MWPPTRMFWGSLGAGCEGAGVVPGWLRRLFKIALELRALFSHVCQHLAASSLSNSPTSPTSPHPEAAKIGDYCVGGMQRHRDPSCWAHKSHVPVFIFYLSPPDAVRILKITRNNLAMPPLGRNLIDLVYLPKTLASVLRRYGITIWTTKADTRGCELLLIGSKGGWEAGPKFGGNSRDRRYISVAGRAVTGAKTRNSVVCRWCGFR
ncbi:hypothetical protein B0I37DRAFT_123788 [Chaetomium sp. MPI-CAGE-AT-0009]|nr:hypothetical protein B0I37DRAFT_123788 [Chaetomium sp. MPI-CAGE-AT-0009]